MVVAQLVCDVDVRLLDGLWFSSSIVHRAASIHFCVGRLSDVEGPKSLKYSAKVPRFCRVIKVLLDQETRGTLLQ